MDELVPYLIKRRMLMMRIVALLAVIALIVSYTIQIAPSTSFDGKYNNLFIFALIMYKLIELPILYYLLLHRHVRALRKENHNEDRLVKLRKHSKLLLFLIPQGNTIFGIIAYKLSGNVMYFLIFSCIALITLYLIKPNALKPTKSNE